MDDFKLKQAGTPGMTNPPTVTPPPPAPVRAAAEIANQKNPVVLPSVDSMVLGASQGLDRGMRSFGSAVAGTASSVAEQTANSAAAARTAPAPNGVYTSEPGANPFAPLTSGASDLIKAGQAENQRIQAIDNTPTQPVGTVGGAISNAWNGMVNKGLDAGVLSPDIVQRREITTPAQQHAGALTPTTPAQQHAGALTPTTPAPEAKPQPAYDGSEADRINAAVAGNTPAAQGNLGDARVTTMPNGQKLFTNVSNDADAIAGLSAKSGMQYSGGAAGMPSPQGNPNLGTAADNMRQIQNMQALSASTPQGGVAILNDPNEAANAEKTKRWALDDAIANMKKAGTRTERAALGQLVNTMAAGQNATEVEGMRQGGQNTRQAGTNAVQMRGQDLTHSAQTRGQDMQHQVGMGNIDANLYGTNMRVQEAATGRKHDLTKLGMINTNENSQIKARTEGLQAVERMKIEAEARKPMKMQTATGEILITRDNSGNMQGVTPTMKKGANGTMEYDLTAFGGMPPPDKKKP